jgi:uncharacterized protein with HEPN domain
VNDAAKKYLYDISKSIGFLSIHLKNIDTIELFSQNITVKRSVERELEIIGEAMNSLIAICPDIKISDSRKIIAMRNRIIHGYDSVDDVVIWNTIIRNIPVLKAEIEILLNSLE